MAWWCMPVPLALGQREEARHSKSSLIYKTLSANSTNKNKSVLKRQRWPGAAWLVLHVWCCMAGASAGRPPSTEGPGKKAAAKKACHKVQAPPSTPGLQRRPLASFTSVIQVAVPRATGVDSAADYTLCYLAFADPGLSSHEDGCICTLQL